MHARLDLDQRDLTDPEGQTRSAPCNTSRPSECGRRDSEEQNLAASATGRGAPRRPPAGNLRITTEHFTFAVQSRGAHRGECVCGYEGPARPTWSGAEADLARHLRIQSQLVDLGRYGVMRVRADASYSFLGAL